VHVTSQARELAKDILRPPVRWLPSAIWLPLEPMTAWLLPHPIRDGFGLSWSRRRERMMQSVALASRALVPHLPPVVRDLPQFRAAQRRVRLYGL